ncbi:unnamed protein product [Orchesella dallaii]|uniref:Transcription termination factor 3, mitochondrial n=1 Tax=Orchesella dallaii TaxID=48710 RepID=A0ABP1S5Z2_9HEXA
MALTTRKVLNSAFVTGCMRQSVLNPIKTNYLQRELFFLQCPCQTSYVYSTQKSYFHFQSIIQIQIQAKHGILLDALHKSRVSASELADLNLKIPDEIRRLKSGSLKWLFDVWPLPKKSLSGLTKAYQIQQDEDDGKKGATRNKKPKTASEEQLHKAIDFLKSNNVAIRRLVKLPWLLTTDPVIVEMSAKRVQKLLRLNNFHVAISFVNLSESQLRQTAAIWANEAKLLSREVKLVEEVDVKFHNRLDFMSYYLKCQTEDVSDMMAKVPKLMTMPLPQIKDYIICLLDVGVKPEYIVGDPWLFLRNPSKMHERIKIIKDKGITDFKPWVFRVSERTFEIHISRAVAEMQLLGDLKGIEGFLQEKLHCDKNTAATMLAKFPSLEAATAVKVNKMIEFLLSQGFSRENIIETPRILAHSVETIAERLEEVTPYQDPLQSFQILCRTNKEYRAIIRKWKRDARQDENADETSISDTISK